MPKLKNGNNRGFAIIKFKKQVSAALALAANGK